MMYDKTVDGGNIVPKHTTVGHAGHPVPAQSRLGPACIISRNTTVGSGTVVGDYVKVHGGCRFGDGVIIMDHAAIRGTGMNPITFGEGTIIGEGSELRHAHFKRGLRLGRNVTLVNCILPSDTQFDDKETAKMRLCKKLKVDKPYQWPAGMTAKLGGHSGKETRTPEELEAVREANYRRQAEEALGALQREAMAGDDFDIIESVEDLDRRIAGRSVLFLDGKHYPLMADHVKAVFLEQLAQGKWS
jgi:NDP-sugar pyrophosphorylase family protein